MLKDLKVCINAFIQDVQTCKEAEQNGNNLKHYLSFHHAPLSAIFRPSNDLVDYLATEMPSPTAQVVVGDKRFTSPRVNYFDLTSPTDETHEESIDFHYRSSSIPFEDDEHRSSLVRISTLISYRHTSLSRNYLHSPKSSRAE